MKVLKIDIWKYETEVLVDARDDADDADDEEEGGRLRCVI